MRQAGNDILQRFMREVLPNATNDERTLAGDLIRTNPAADTKVIREFLGHKKAPPTDWLSGALDLVAGAGFEPAAFRL